MAGGTRESDNWGDVARAIPTTANALRQRQKGFKLDMRVKDNLTTMSVAHAMHRVK